MSNELINAAQRGDLAQVKNRIENCHDDVNFTQKPNKSTALSVAIENERYNVAQYLLTKNVDIEQPSGSSHFPNVLTQAMASKKAMKNTHNEDVFNLLKILLSKTKDLNPTFGFYGHHSLLQFLADKSLYEDQGARFELYFYETVLRNDKILLNEIKDHYHVKTNVEIFKAFTKDRQFTTDELFQACTGLQFAAKAQLISSAVAAEIMKIIDPENAFLSKKDKIEQKLETLEKKVDGLSTQLTQMMDMLKTIQANLPKGVNVVSANDTAERSASTFFRT